MQIKSHFGSKVDSTSLVIWLLSSNRILKQIIYLWRCAAQIELN